MSHHDSDGAFYVLATAVIQHTPFPPENVFVVSRGDSYASLTKVFDARTPPPNIPGLVRFAFSFPPQVGDNGHIVSMGTLEFRQGDRFVTHKGLYVIQPDGTIRTVAVENGQPPDTPIGSFYSSDVFQFEINDAGHTAFKGSIALPGAPFQDRTIFAEGIDGQLRLVAPAKCPCTGYTNGCFFWSPGVDDSSAGHFRATRIQQCRTSRFPGRVRWTWDYGPKQYWTLGNRSQRR